MVGKEVATSDAFTLAAGALQHQRPSYPRPTSPLLHPRPHPPHLRARHLRCAHLAILESRRFFTPVDLFAFAAARLRARRPKGQSFDTRSLARGNRFSSTILDFHRNCHLSWRSPAHLLFDSALNAAAADPILIQFLLAIAINIRHHEHPLFSLFQRSAEDHSGDPVWSLLA